MLDKPHLFWRHVFKVRGDCWWWTGEMGSDGYGITRLKAEANTYYYTYKDYTHRCCRTCSREKMRRRALAERTAATN